jgi:hypothetical protein
VGSRKVKKYSGEDESLVKSLIPAQIRTFASTLAGNRDPITEKDFTQSELDQARSAIMRSRTDQLKKFRKRKLDETVGYQHYGDDEKRQKDTMRDFSPLPQDAMRNTLGRFAYKKDPNGHLIATDSYDFKDDLVSENPKIPRSKDYENLSTTEKIAKLAKDSLNVKEMGGLSTLPSRVGSAFIGKASRPVRLDLGEAPFKKGGKVTASTRGDGIAQKGRTKGRFV